MIYWLALVGHSEHLTLAPVHADSGGEAVKVQGAFWLFRRVNCLLWLGTCAYRSELHLSTLSDSSASHLCASFFLSTLLSPSQVNKNFKDYM